MNILSGLLIVTCFLLLGASRLKVSVRMMVAQGIILGVMPLLHEVYTIDAMTWLVAVSSFLLKGCVLPLLLLHALNRSTIRREIEPYVGFNISILVGICLLGLSCWVAMYLLAAGGYENTVLMTAALFMVFTGLFLVVSRKKAITQVLGYLVMENGIYAAGAGFGSEFNALVELGVLLDVSVGVFLMGIMVFHINREFDHIDVAMLSELNDSPAFPSDEGGTVR